MDKRTTAVGKNANIDAVTVLGIDLAKNVFAIHGVNAAGKVVLAKPKVQRDQLLHLLAQLPPCVIGMEACSGAHHWARELIKLGHTPKLMAPKFVSPYRMQGKSGKNDANDAAAICEAVTRPTMRFVPIKSQEAQSLLALHRVRQGFIAERTATINRIRGLLAAFGIVLPQKSDSIRHGAGHTLEHLPAFAARCIADLLEQVTMLDARIKQYDSHVEQLARQDERCTRLMQIPGLGAISATALIASIGNGHDFKNGRQLAAWLGLVPRQHSSGGKPKLGAITKAGDRYLRTLLILGARSMLAVASRKTDRLSLWASSLHARVGYGKALVAIAAKNARMVWAMLAKGQPFALAV